MADPTQEVKRSHASDAEGITRNQVLQAIVFGLIFGFLLQKGGVAKYNVLLGTLLFQDFTVIKIMVTAIAVGMVGILALSRAGKVELKLKPTRLASVIIGGLIFGAGFACGGYCPGTGAAALGQMNWDALFMVAGMMLGSYLFAEASDWLSRTVDKVGDRGKITVPDALHVRRSAFALGCALVLGVALFALEHFSPTNASAVGAPSRDHNPAHLGSTRSR
jgi:uncharacterized protein